MKVLIVYDSFYGNTEKIARSIESVFEDTHVAIVKASAEEASKAKEVDLLIVGSPTRAFSASENTKAFLKALGKLNGVKACAFDTRVDTGKVNSRILNFLVKIFGYAAKPISRALSKKGCNIILEEVGFFVKGSEGPLEEGEIERSIAWAKEALDKAKKQPI